MIKLNTQAPDFPTKSDILNSCVKYLHDLHQLRKFPPRETRCINFDVTYLQTLGTQTTLLYMRQESDVLKFCNTINKQVYEASRPVLLLYSS